jgi:NADPH-dependent 2,4-dienoyl-CoA reductase/sulfur reductase-like enzyme
MLAHGGIELVDRADERGSHVSRLVVIGGDAGGMTAAAIARRRRDPDELEIVALERGSFTSYVACGIPYFVGDVVHDADALIARTPEEHRRRGIDVRIHHEVVAIDVDEGAVQYRDLHANTEHRLGYDQLIVATGAVPRRPPIPGIDAVGVFGVQTLDDGVALRRFVDDERPERAVVIGGGYIGLEMAEAMVRRGLHVTLIERAPQPMTTLDPDMGTLVAEALREIGVEVVVATAATAVETEGGRARAVATAGATFPADIVVMGLGVRPGSDLAGAAAIPIGETGGIVTDDRMQTRIPGVWAAGDCVEVRHRVTGHPVAIALGTHANKQGRVVGLNVTGGDARFPGVIGTAVTKVCDYEIGRTGLDERQAAAAGFDSVAATIEATTRASYYPGAAPITVKVMAERGTGRILGGQIIGREGAAKRIDVIATAIWNEMPVRDVAMMDLSYAPPLSPVWDPVLLGARKAAELV